MEKGAKRTNGFNTVYCCGKPTSAVKLVVQWFCLVLIADFETQINSNQGWGQDSSQSAGGVGDAGSGGENAGRKRWRR